MSGGADKEFVLGVDLDGVVADFVQGLHPIAAEWIGVSPQDLTQEISWGFPEWGLDAVGGYEALHRYAVKERDLFLSLPVMRGAAPALRRLSAAGVRIRIITHRLYIPWFHEQAIQQTVAWLERNGVPYWDICFMRDKSAVGAHLYLEDNESNIDALRNAGATTFVVYNTTNRHVEGPGADNWAELERMIFAEVETKRPSRV